MRHRAGARAQFVLDPCGEGRKELVVRVVEQDPADDPQRDLPCPHREPDHRAGQERLDRLLCRAGDDVHIGLEGRAAQVRAERAPVGHMARAVQPDEGFRAEERAERPAPGMAHCPVGPEDPGDRLGLATAVVVQLVKRTDATWRTRSRTSERSCARERKCTFFT